MIIYHWKIFTCVQRRTTLMVFFITLSGIQHRRSKTNCFHKYLLEQCAQIQDHCFIYKFLSMSPLMCFPKIMSPTKLLLFFHILISLWLGSKIKHSRHIPMFTKICLNHQFKLILECILFRWSRQDDLESILALKIDKSRTLPVTCSRWTIDNMVIYINL